MFLRAVPGYPGHQYVVFDFTSKRPVHVSMFKYSNVVARKITWRSWLWQWQSFPGWRGSLAIGIKAFVGPDMPLDHHAADQCSWIMSKQDVVDF